MMYTYNAKVLRVVDGDTLDLMIDLGFRQFSKQRVRLYGVDTPETFGVKKGSAEWTAGVKAKAFVEHWLATHCPDGVMIKSHDGKQLGQGKYGRWLVHVMPPGSAGVVKDLAHELVKNGHAETVQY